MTEFMQRGTVIVGGRDKAAARRQADEVLAQVVKGFAPCLADGRAAGGNQVFGSGMLLGFGINGRRRDDMRGQSLALLHIEDGEALEERDAGGIVAAGLYPFALGLGNKAVGVANDGATFALADMTAKAQGLAEGQPFLRGKAPTNDGIPQN